MLASQLPATFRGYPVAFPATRDPGGGARHRVHVAGLGGWLTGQLGFDPRQQITLLDWLSVPAQRLAEVTTGAVFHDEPGELTQARARLARELMRLCLLMHRRYPPYSKWLGSAFARLPGGTELAALLAAAVSARGWPAREAPMCRAYETVAARHNELGLTRPLDPRARDFYDRPYQVIGAERSLPRCTRRSPTRGSGRCR